MWRVRLLALLWLLAPSSAGAGGPELLLFDARTQEKFAGCLTCDRAEPEAVCNRLGDYGSRLMDNSIWNMHGKFGSDFSEDSPWNDAGEGLVIVDEKGKFYGRFTRNSKANRGQPVIASARYIMSLYEKYNDLSVVRDLLCER